jgi:hypothetical protein
MIGVALRLITENDALAHITHGLPDFGKATVIAGTEYDDLAVEKLFLSSTDPLKARDRTEYESAGREALKYLICKGDQDDYRLLIATDDELWKAMNKNKNVGSLDFKALIRRYTNATIAPDTMGKTFLDIITFADVMEDCAAALIKVRKVLKDHPNVDRNNHDFLHLRRQLAGDLEKVAGKTTVNFGGPWGLIAMCLLARKVATVKPSYSITNPHVTLALDQMAAAVGG